MKYTFTFKFQSGISYPLQFFWWSEGIYPLYFWGYSPIEIIKYTAKCACLDENESKGIIRSVINLAEVKRNILLKLRRDGVDSIENIDINDPLFSDVKIDLRKFIPVFIETLLETNKFTYSKDVEQDIIRDITYKVKTYFAELTSEVAVKNIWGGIELVTDISKIKYSSGTSASNVFDITKSISIVGIDVDKTNILNNKSRFLDIKIPNLSIIKNTSKSVTQVTEVGNYTIKNINIVVPSRKFKVKDVNSVVGINSRKTKNITPNISIYTKTIKCTENVKLEYILNKFRKDIETTNIEILPKNNFRDSENAISEIERYINNGGLEKAIAEIMKDKASLFGVDFKGTDVDKKSKNRIASSSGKDLDTYERVKDVVINSINININKSKNTEFAPTEEVSKIKLGGIEPRVVLDKYTYNYATPISVINKKIRPSVEPNVLIDKNNCKNVSVVSIEINGDTYTDVNIGRRWRFKTGVANDKIWLNPVNTDLMILAEKRKQLTINTRKVIIDSLDYINIEEITFENVLNKLRLNIHHYITSQIELLNDYCIILEYFYDLLNQAEPPIEHNTKTIKDLILLIVNQAIEMYSTIYIEPFKNEKKLLAVEAKISFKAMLDFILFIEQLIYTNRYFYAASRAVTAVKDLERILEEWLDDSRPDDVPEEYQYLLRWFKWWADGVYNEHINDMGLNGMEVLNNIKDKMINYFESRWGKRIVEYGADGMYCYSKDNSYINRLRGKKHGDNRYLVDRDMMVDEYGVGEQDIIYDIDDDHKQ